MALGDGITWDETTPTDGTNAVEIDDYNRDLRKGTRLRMDREHEWPGSQSATSEAGAHKFITLQEQAAKPTVGGTQLGAVYIKTVGAGAQELFFEDESGNEEQLSSAVPSGVIAMWSGSIATIPDGWYLCDGNNSTPNLTNRFIVGADADDGGTAKSTITGSAAQTHDGLVINHTHTYDKASTSGPSVADGVSGTPFRTNTSTASGNPSSNNHATRNIARFYALAFIMKS